jgi:NADH-quinone oxidoreductase subunit G
VSEPKPPEDPDSPLAFSMEGYSGEPPAALIPRFWAPGWNSDHQALNKFQSEVGGPLEGGDPGIRLIEPGRSDAPLYFQRPPQAFQSRSGEWLVLPLHHIFGSEELSIHTSGVAELSPRPYLALNPADASRLGLSDGQETDLPIGETPRRLLVKLMPELPAGVAGLPAGLPEMWGIELPRWSRLRA